MNHDRPHMALTLLLQGVGTHIAAWRHQSTPVGAQINFDYFKQVTQNAERAGYDMIFLADSLFADTSKGAARRYPRHPHLDLEPLTLLSALAAVTTNIGLGATVSTTYSNPYITARAFASLDHISGGRAAWNVVTSQSEQEARNFGADPHPRHADRYARAREYLEVVTKLWDSWEDGAIVANKQSGIALDASKLHAINHKGDFYEVAGPLNVSRTPQGRPLVIQAGSSEEGQELAAATADIVFTAQPDKARATKFYRDVKDRLPKFGRAPGQLIVMPGIAAVVAPTEREAHEKFQSLQDLIDPVVGLALLANALGQQDLGDVELDQPLPEIPDSNASKSRLEMIRRFAKEEALTVRQMYTRLAAARGHFTLVGSAEHVADTLTDWFNDGAADGFMFVPQAMPAFYDDFNAQVLPILRERGVIRGAYTGGTLRDNLGLPRPPSPWQAP